MSKTPYRSARRDRYLLHNWSPWVRAKRDDPDGGPAIPTDILVKTCSRCGRARVRRAP